MEPYLKIVEYCPGDEQQILDLFYSSFNRKLDLKFWEWRFKNCPAGRGVIQLFWDEKHLAAHYAVTPVLLNINGSEILTGLSGTTMTHPAYRGKQLFGKLATATYQRMMKSSFKMVWGFPNNNSHRGFVKNLGWKDIYEIPVLRLSLEKSDPLPTPEKNIKVLDQFDSRFDRHWNRVKNNYNIIAKRDCAHLSWRYTAYPEERYHIAAFIDGAEVLGYAVYKYYHEEIQIVDLLSEKNNEVRRHLIFHIANVAVLKKFKTVSLWLNVTDPLHQDLEKIGFCNEAPITYVGGLILNNGLLKNNLYDFRNWHISMGDSDVF